MKGKDSVSECNEKFDYQDTLADMILTQFNREIKYDYAIPNPCDILKIVSCSLDQWETDSKLKGDIAEIVEENNYTGDAILRGRLWNEWVFGHEWFYMLGDFFRYRKEEKAKAFSRIYSSPKLSNIKKVDCGCKEATHSSLKKDTEEFVAILTKNIERFYNQWEKEHKIKL